MAEHVARARNSLGLTHRELVESAGPGLSIAVLSKIENAAQESYKPRTIAALTRALGWPDDAIDRIRAGRPPNEPLVEPDERTIEERLDALEAELAALRQIVDRERDERRARISARVERSAAGAPSGGRQAG